MRVCVLVCVCVFLCVCVVCVACESICCGLCVCQLGSMVVLNPAGSHSFWEDEEDDAPDAVPQAECVCASVSVYVCE